MKKKLFNRIKHPVLILAISLITGLSASAQEPTAASSGRDHARFMTFHAPGRMFLHPNWSHRISLLESWMLNPYDVINSTGDFIIFEPVEEEPVPALEGWMMEI